ncbi:MAG: ribosome maturation factor RimP [bacterium]
MQNLVEQLRRTFLPILEDENLELVDLAVKGKPGNLVVKVFVDKPGGITLDMCESLSRQFSDRLEIEDVIQDKYRLEVSSPGINRPLRSVADFSRKIGKEVKVYYEENLQQQIFEGRIVEVLNEMVHVAGKEEAKKIPISKIRMGKLKLPW